MLKNKKNIRILLPIVIVIYGLLFYRIFDTLNPDEIQFSADKAYSYSPAQFKEREQFDLLPIDNDPFLGTPIKRKRAINTVKRNSEKEVNWPSIEYHGLVSTSDLKQNVFIISINGNQFTVKKGESADGIRVISGNNKSIRLQFDGSNKEFSIK